MSDIDERFARSLHHASKQVAFGEPFVPPIVNTSVYRLEPEPSGPYQYARWGNPTWTALEEALFDPRGRRDDHLPFGYGRNRRRSLFERQAG